MMKNAYLPKISILLQFGSEILALLMFGTETKLEGFVWSHQGITELISHPQIAIRC